MSRRSIIKRGKLRRVRLYTVWVKAWNSPDALIINKPYLAYPDGFGGFLVDFKETMVPRFLSVTGEIWSQ